MDPIPSQVFDVVIPKAPPQTPSLLERYLPEPKDAKVKMQKHTVCRDTTTARIIRSLPIILGFLSGVGLGALTGLAIAGILVTPVGWGVLGGAALLAILMGIPEAGIKGAGLGLASVVSGWTLGLGSLLMAKAANLAPDRQMKWVRYEEYGGGGHTYQETDGGSIFGIGLGGFLSTVAGLIGLGASTAIAYKDIRKKSDKKFLNLASLEYGMPKTKEECQKFLENCFNPNETRKLMVDDHGKLRFISAIKLERERLWSKMRTYSGINQKVIEMQMLKLLTYGLKKGWIEGITAEQKEKLCKRIGLGVGDECLIGMLDKIKELNENSSKKDRESLDLVNYEYFINNVQKLVEMQANKKDIADFYFTKGSEALRKGDDNAAFFFFGQGVRFNEKCIKGLANCYLEGRGTPKNIALALKWYRSINDSAGIARIQREVIEDINDRLHAKDISDADLKVHHTLFSHLKDQGAIRKIAGIYLQKGNLEKAEVLFTSISDDVGLKAITEIYMQNKQWGPLSKLLMFNRDEQALLTLAKHLIELGEYEKGIQCYADLCAVKFKKYFAFYVANQLTAEAVSLIENITEWKDFETDLYLAHGIINEFGIKTPTNKEKAIGFYRMAAAKEIDDRGLAHQGLKRLNEL